MNLLALAGSSYETTARGILYVVYEMLWKLIYYVLLLIDEITNLFYRIAGINISNGVVENKNIFDQLLSQNIISSWYGLFVLVAAGLVLVFTLVAVLRAVASEDIHKKSLGPVLRNVGLALLLLVVIGPILLLLISFVSNMAILVSSIGGNESISIADIIFNNSGNLITVYNETFTKEVTSFRELGNDFLYELVYNPSTAEGATQLTFHWYIALLGGAFVLYNLVVIVIEIVKRIFNIVILYVASPFAISKLALDDGKSFKAWQNKFFYEFILLLTQIGAFMLFAALVNVLSNITFVATSTSTGAIEGTPSLIEGEEAATPVVVDEAYHLIDGIGRTLIIMAAVSVTRESAKMLAELLTNKESRTESLLESVLNRVSSRGTTPTMRTRTITKTTNTTRKETVFVEPSRVGDSVATNRSAIPTNQGNTTNNVANSVNMNVTQNYNTTNEFSSTNNITNRVGREGVKQGTYADKITPSTVYVSTTRIEAPSGGNAGGFKYMDEATKKAATTVVKEYNNASSKLSGAIKTNDSTNLKQTFSDYTKAYNKEAEILSKNYRQFETRANASMKSELASQARQELKNISQSYRKAQMDYNKTAEKLKQYDGERMSTAEALKVKEKADKQRETLMSASNRAAQFYENQKKGE